MVSINTDMPKSCNECPLIVPFNEKEKQCFWTKRIIPNKLAESRNGFCPLNENQIEAEWLEENDENSGPRRMWFCSNCGPNASGVYERTRFCPDCGARMRQLSS